MDEKSPTTQQKQPHQENKDEKPRRTFSIADKVLEPIDIKLQISAEEMRKKQQKKDEDPRITKFKNTEVENG